MQSKLLQNERAKQLHIGRRQSVSVLAALLFVSLHTHTNQCTQSVLDVGEFFILLYLRVCFCVRAQKLNHLL